MVTSTKEKAIETQQVLMRAYGNTYYSWNGGPQPFLTYSRFAEGIFLATLEREKDATVGSYRDHMLQRVEDGVYSLPKTRRYLLDASPEELRNAMIEAIRNEEGTGKLWTSGRNVQGYMGHDVLTGEVPSR